jgi:hypothetical protein
MDTRQDSAAVVISVTSPLDGDSTKHPSRIYKSPQLTEFGNLSKLTQGNIEGSGDEVIGTASIT